MNNRRVLRRRSQKRGAWGLEGLERRVPILDRLGQATWISTVWIEAARAGRPPYAKPNNNNKYRCTSILACLKDWMGLRE